MAAHQLTPTHEVYTWIQELVESTISAHRYVGAGAVSHVAFATTTAVDFPQTIPISPVRDSTSNVDPDVEILLQRLLAELPAKRTQISSSPQVSISPISSVAVDGEPGHVHGKLSKTASVPSTTTSSQRKRQHSTDDSCPAKMAKIEIQIPRRAADVVVDQIVPPKVDSRGGHAGGTAVANALSGEPNANQETHTDVADQPGISTQSKGLIGDLGSEKGNRVGEDVEEDNAIREVPSLDKTNVVVSNTATQEPELIVEDKKARKSSRRKLPTAPISSLGRILGIPF